MKFRKLGKSNEKLSSIGLGCMGMSHSLGGKNVYGTRDDKESIATLNKALELGINFWDTSDYYGDGENEELISEVLVPNRDKVFIATKFGFRYTEKGNPLTATLDGSSQWVKKAIELSLKRLKVDYIDLYYLHRVDPNTPIEETVEAMADLVKEGKVRYLGLSEVSAKQIKAANAIHPISAVQSEYSMITREVENDIFPLLKELDISFIPFSPLGRGMFINDFDKNNVQDSRLFLPRFQGEHLENNSNMIQDLTEFAHGKNITLSQLALAWILAKGSNIIPIPGTKRSKYLTQNAEAVDVDLNDNEISEIENIISKYPNIGDRYPKQTVIAPGSK